jgi:hypothetical protein
VKDDFANQDGVDHILIALISVPTFCSFCVPGNVFSVSVGPVSSLHDELDELDVSI